MLFQRANGLSASPSRKQINQYAAIDGKYPHYFFPLKSARKVGGAVGGWSPTTADSNHPLRSPS